MHGFDFNPELQILEQNVGGTLPDGVKEVLVDVGNLMQFIRFIHYHLALPGY